MTRLQFLAPVVLLLIGWLATTPAVAKISAMSGAYDGKQTRSTIQPNARAKTSDHPPGEQAPPLRRRKQR